MKTILQIIEAAKDGFQPEPLEAYYTILALDYLLAIESEQLGLICQAGAIGRPPSSITFREIGNKSMTRLKIASTSAPQALLGQQNDPQTPEYQEKRRKRKADAAAKRAVKLYRGNGGNGPQNLDRTAPKA